MSQIFSNDFGFLGKLPKADAVNRSLQQQSPKLVTLVETLVMLEDNPLILLSKVVVKHFFCPVDEDVLYQVVLGISLEDFYALFGLQQLMLVNHVNEGQ